MMLSRTYCPSDQLRPYIRRFYVFEAELPDEFVIEDFLLAETAFVRCLLKGDWRGEVAPGEWSNPSKTLMFGSNEFPFRVRVQGSFAVAGFAIRPSAWHCLARRPHFEFKDKLIPLEDVHGVRATEMCAAVQTADDDAGKIAAMEHFILDRIETVGNPEPDEKMAHFEKIARTNSTIRIEQAAEQIGLSTRQIGRRCKASFGLTPKAVLRRSRFLDIATAIRGFSSPSDTDLAELRYYDQSHLNREFKRFTKMTPKEFKEAMTPLQTAGLKLRQESLYED
ncbi:helix-turn-helix domain-containing protein [Erythrobacter sp. W53]|uniref:helix-turn-helix domain-containing protein n=1 Tax=Erythrobacteraceae TaxID=335929 RepID=UPI0036D3CD75